jgi:hypothetical protein
MSTDKDKKQEQTPSEKRFEQGTAQDVFATKDESASEAKHQGNDVATNDGAVLETLDTAFHGVPQHADNEENLSGSDRADLYEKRSYGKPDDEEELDARNPI